jgi:hypothetical protein
VQSRFGREAQGHYRFSAKVGKQPIRRVESGLSPKDGTAIGM